MNNTFYELDNNIYQLKNVNVFFISAYSKRQVLIILDSVFKNNLIKKYNLEVFNIEQLSTHGGSIRYFIKRISNTKIKINNSVKRQLNKELTFKMDKFNTYINFKKKVELSKKKLVNLFNNTLYAIVRHCGTTEFPRERSRSTR